MHCSALQTDCNQKSEKRVQARKLAWEPPLVCTQSKVVDEKQVSTLLMGKDADFFNRGSGDKGAQSLQIDHFDPFASRGKARTQTRANVSGERHPA